MKNIKKDTEGDLSVGKVIGVVILVIIGLLMLPIVVDAVETAKADPNVTGTSDTLLDMVKLFYILGIVLAAVMWVVHEAKKVS